MVLVVTPVQKELVALVASFEAAGHPAQEQTGRVRAFLIPTLGMLCAAAGHGKVRFAVTTQYLIATYGPIEVVVVAGASGALSVALRPGDVVIGTAAVEHDYKPRFDGIFPPPSHPADARAYKALLGVQPSRDTFQIHTGPIASGDEDIMDAERAKELVELTGALCVAWEGAGGARAAAFNGVPFVEVRAVTDAADGAAAGSYRVHLSRAVGNIGEVLLAWLVTCRQTTDVGRRHPEQPPA